MVRKHKHTLTPGEIVVHTAVPPSKEGSISVGSELERKIDRLLLYDGAMRVLVGGLLRLFVFTYKKLRASLRYTYY